MTLRKRKAPKNDRARMYVYMGVSILFAVQKGGAGIDQGTFKIAYSILYD